ncbi:MAG: tetratricopeptide repeat protein [Candidatus Heimdallarchaeota archaeon]|nr:MAG: tetratricopeptide repeat protein [Candidatus Heimdallarchaeota archaeon]
MTWKVIFALGIGQDEEIELFDAATLVDWDPEFKGELIASFFKTDYTWIPGLKSVTRDDVIFPPINFFVVVGRKWGKSQAPSIPLGVLFEFTEGDLRLRGVGPKSLSEKAGGDSNLLLNLVSDLFDKPDLWKSKISISAKPKSEWKVISDIIGEEPWLLIEQGRRIMKTDPRKAMENFLKAYKIFDILTDINGKFHAGFAQAELSLDSMNFDLTKNRLEALWEFTTQLGDPMLEENVLSTEGILLYENHLYEQAIAKFEQALERAKRANIHRAVVNAYCNIGECYYRVQKFEEAMKNFDKSRSLAESRQDRYSLAMSQVNLAKVLGQYIRQGDSSSAAQAAYYLEEAIQLFNELDDKKGLLIAHGLFGEIEALQGGFEKALMHFEFAAEEAQTTSEHQFQEFYRLKAQEMKDRLYDL